VVRNTRGGIVDYLNRTRPGDYYSIGGTNIVAGSQGRVVQNNHNNALDPSALREFAAVVKQFAPNLGAEPDQQKQLVRDAQALIEEADGAAEPCPFTGGDWGSVWRCWWVRLGWVARGFLRGRGGWRSWGGCRGRVR
jgi:hypothetical protein